MQVWLLANTLRYPQGGGHRWAYLNWALGLRCLGCQVVWLERVQSKNASRGKLRELLAALRSALEPFGLAHRIALCSYADDPILQDASSEWISIDAAGEADLLLDMDYLTWPEITGRFKRSALIDIDPGLSQTLRVVKSSRDLAPHDTYFSIGETVGQPGSLIPDLGLKWNYTPPCVHLESWPVHPAPNGAPFTTISHWNESSVITDDRGNYVNDKRQAFRPYFNLPTRTSQPLELALCLGTDAGNEGKELRDSGWNVRETWDVAATSDDYRRYIQNSKGEFSAAKPLCLRLQNAWVSDRSICYLASGKPVIVENTGPSRFLPDAEGLFRFRTPEEAAWMLDTVAADYERQCRLARELAAEYFDAKKNVASVLDRAMG
jgi:hypothetical protein